MTSSSTDAARWAARPATATSRPVTAPRRRASVRSRSQRSRAPCRLPRGPSGQPTACAARAQDQRAPRPVGRLVSGWIAWRGDPGEERPRGLGGRRPHAPGLRPVHAAPAASRRSGPGRRGQCRGASASSASASQFAASGPKSDRQAGPSSASPAAVAKIERSSTRRALFQRVGERGLGVDPFEAVVFEPLRPQKRRADSQWKDRRADVVVEPRGERAPPCAPHLLSWRRPRGPLPGSPPAPVRRRRPARSAPPPPRPRRRRRGRSRQAGGAMARS